MDADRLGDRARTRGRSRTSSRCSRVRDPEPRTEASSPVHENRFPTVKARPTNAAVRSIVRATAPTATPPAARPGDDREHDPADRVVRDRRRQDDHPDRGPEEVEVHQDPGDHGDRGDRHRRREEQGEDRLLDAGGTSCSGNTIPSAKPASEREAEAADPAADHRPRRSRRIPSRVSSPPIRTRKTTPIHDRTSRRLRCSWSAGNRASNACGETQPSSDGSEQHPAHELAHVQRDADPRRDLAAEPRRDEQDRDLDEEEEELLLGHGAPPSETTTGLERMRSIDAIYRSDAWRRHWTMPPSVTKASSIASPSPTGTDPTTWT